GGCVGVGAILLASGADRGRGMNVVRLEEEGFGETLARREVEPEGEIQIQGRRQAETRAGIELDSLDIGAQRDGDRFPAGNFDVDIELQFLPVLPRELATDRSLGVETHDDVA